MKLHLWTTPNGYKPLIMLEEIGADFELVKVPLDGTQKKPDYVKLNPNGRIPTLVDGDLVVFESGAILLKLYFCRTLLLTEFSSLFLLLKFWQNSP